MKHIRINQKIQKMETKFKQKKKWGTGGISPLKSYYYFYILYISLSNYHILCGLLGLGLLHSQIHNK